jgi:heterodisulfide reductase subunit B
MRIPYYPGCTVKTTAKNLEESALASAAALGIELEELERWNCCGVVASLAGDNLMEQLAPIRNLIRVQEQGADRVVTMCSLCYGTLKAANALFRRDEEKREKINQFMYEEPDYEGGVEVLHLLEVLRDEIGFDTIAARVGEGLAGLRIAPYYGCLLLRPRELGLDDPEDPHILEDLMESVGADVIVDPYRTECCGSYQTVGNIDLVAERTRRIVGSAVRRGADIIVTSCPVCHFNLDRRQRDVLRIDREFSGLPVLYFTQVLAFALDLPESVMHFDLHEIDPRPVLESKARTAGVSE